MKAKTRTFSLTILSFAILCGVRAFAHEETSATEPDINEQFSNFNESSWKPMTHTFGCNDTQFNPSNVIKGDEGIALQINGTKTAERNYSAAEIVLQNPATGDDAQLKYGRYEVRMKASRLPGTISSFFLYRRDPWQEIDIEIKGAEPTKMLTNVYFNPGPEGAHHNKGNMSVTNVPLGFDASADFHTYAFEWDKTEIRWYADGKLIFSKKSMAGIPNLPMTLRTNHWLTCDKAAHWAGSYEEKPNDPIQDNTYYEYVRIWKNKKLPHLAV